MSTIDEVLDPRARQEARAFLDVFNQGDLHALKAHLGERLSADAVQRRSLESRAIHLALLARETGGVDPREVGAALPGGAVIRCAARRNGLLYRLQVDVEREPPHKLLGAGVGLAIGAPGQQPRGTEDELFAALDALIAALAEADAFSGVVLVAKDGEVRFACAHGFANQTWAIPMRADTKLNLASMGKMFTGVAIAQLIERGQLAFGDFLAKHLPEYRPDVAERVTLHQLLTHTSGLGTFFNHEFDARLRHLRTVRDYVPLFADEPLAFEPGQRYRYSNAGYILLGRVVEEVSGSQYDDYVREHIFLPAGMVATDFYDVDRETAQCAMGYTREAPDGPPDLGPRWSNVLRHSPKGGPSGGSFSTAQDLLQFDRALRRSSLISRDMMEILLTGKVMTAGNPSQQYGYGFQVARVEGQRVVGHSGGFPGISTQMDMFLDSGYTTIVLSNFDPPIASEVSWWLRRAFIPLMQPDR
jgi:CubicO group peptidase (beta-lactamase class C family)